VANRPIEYRSACAQRTEGVTLDHAARVYDWLAPLMTLGAEGRLHRGVVRRLVRERPGRVLDVGCGTGVLTRQVFDALPDTPGKRVCGIDAAEAMIDVARRKAGTRPGLEFTAALAEELPYPDGSFDCVLSTFFFHHLNAVLKRRALAEIHRVLRPGGHVLVLDVDVPYSLWGRVCAWSGYVLFRQEEIAENIRGEFRAALRDAPFRAGGHPVARFSGYLGLFELRTPQENPA